MKSQLKNTEKRRSFTFKSVLMTMFALVWAMNAQAQDVQWKKHFGASGSDGYSSVTEVSDGVVVVGGSSVFSNGDWADVTGNGGTDAIIIKYDHTGNIVWKSNFGGSSSDGYSSVTAVSDGVVAVGSSSVGSFGNGDWADEPVLSTRGSADAIIVKYDHAGDVIWKKVLSTPSNVDNFNSVTAVSDGLVVVGSSTYVGYGDLAGLTGNGASDAIIIKYDNAGNVMWKKNFGGNSYDEYDFVTAVSDGVVAVGHSYPESFGTGDWENIAGKGGHDAIIVKYDYNGNVIWKKNFGGSSHDWYISVTEVSDGVVAVGYSSAGSFGTGDWENVAGKGGQDAIIVKYDNSGNIVWKKNFGGSNTDEYYSVTAVSDGILAVGRSDAGSFGNGDWENIATKGTMDAVIVKYDNSGNVLWKNSFGAQYSQNIYNSVTVTQNDIVTVGQFTTSYNASTIYYGDWGGIMMHGGSEGIIVKYSNGGNSITYTVTFAGENITISPQNIEHGSTVTAPETPEREGYDFDGWFTDNGTFANEWNFATDIVTQDTTLWAKWNETTGITLSELNISEGILTPAFSPTVYNYTVNVAYSVSSIEITATSTNPEATISGDTGTLPLNVGANPFTISVTEDGKKATQNYTITVTRASETGISETETGKINIYPNPTNGLITICDVRYATCDNQKIEIFDVMGRAVVVAPVETRHATSLQSEIGNRTSEIEMNISHLPAGIYFLRITTDDGVVTRKVVKFY